MAIQSAGLGIQLEAKEPSSYPGTGSTWTNLSAGLAVNATNYGTVFQSATPKHFLFNNNDDSMALVANTNYKFTSGVAKGIGAWINLNEVSSTHTHPIMSRKAGGNGFGWEFSVVNREVIFKYKNSAIDITAASTTAPIALTGWHYIFIKYQPGSSGTSVVVYVNGIQVANSAANNTVADTYNGDILVGYDISRAPANFYPGRIAAIHFYLSDVSPSTALNNYNDQQAYYNLVPVTITETPATASALFVDPTVSVVKNVNYQESSIITTALMTEPTIIIVNYDSVNIFTSITATTEFPEPTISVATNISNTASPMTASAEMPAHTNIAGTGVLFNAEEALASALFVEPASYGSGEVYVTPVPITASALFVDPNTSVTPNYKNQVLQLNPSFFATDAEDATPTDGNVDSYVPRNYGYENWGSASSTPTITAFPTTSPMSAIGNGKVIHKAGSATTGTNFINWVDANAQATGTYFNTSGSSKTIEFWIKPTENFIGKILDFGDSVLEIENSYYAHPNQTFTCTSGQTTINKPILYAAKKLTLTLNGSTTLTHSYSIIGTTQFTSCSIHNESTATSASESFVVLPLNQWNHVAITINSVGSSTTCQTWLNGSMVAATTGTWVSTSPGISSLQLYTASSANTDYKFDMAQVALYKTVLTNSNIIANYTFIATSSPNRIIDATAYESAATLVNPVITSSVNNTFPATPITASTLLVDSTLVVEVSDIYNAEPIEVSALLVNPSFYGDPDATITASPLTAAADIPQNIYRLDTAYFSYVQTNIAPHRFVTFDDPENTKDWGSDNDFGSAAPFEYTGSITAPIFGLNNNSLLSNGTSYTTSGLVMKESEHDDAWGTDVKTWHTSFWIQKDITDTSPNGLRVIANLTSYQNNKHLIVYQYNNYIYLQMDDKVHAVQTFQSSVNANVFDGIKHHIVITSKNDNKIQIYKNKTLIMNANFGSINVVTTNSSSYWAPNTETNNKPRFSVGALITSYAETNLPVIPTASKLIIDEVHWALTHINSTQVTNLYNAMPYKVEINWFADPALSNSSDIVDPTFGVGSGIVATPLVATGLINEVTITADKEKIINATPITASALAVEPFSVIADNINPINVVSDIFVASALMVQPTVPRIMFATPLTATARMAATSPYFDEYQLLIVQQSRLPLGTSYVGTWSVGDVD
jgi:hypothetical protein